MQAGQSSERRGVLVQGEYRVRHGRNAVLTVVFGPCIAACVRDLMALLFNSLMRAGADCRRLEAKLFGRGSIMETYLASAGSTGTSPQHFFAKTVASCLEAASKVRGHTFLARFGPGLPNGRWR
jgi:chemotaxis receptor (MCP) glutamine deamidase CheD